MSCAVTVVTELYDIDGVLDVELAFNDDRVEVVFDGAEVQVDELVDILTALGYPPYVREVRAEPDPVE
jgi:copper chaperone CopZ